MNQPGKIFLLKIVAPGMLTTSFLQFYKWGHQNAVYVTGGAVSQSILKK